LFKVRQAIHDALNNPSVSLYDIQIEFASLEEQSNRRASSSLVSVTYVIRVAESDTESVQESATSADLMGALSDAGLAVESVENSNTGAEAATTPAPAVTTAVSQPRFIIVTIVFDLPEGAYMSQVQQDALAAAYLDAYSFSLDTPVTVAVDADGIVTIRCTVDFEPSDSDLTPKVLPISYTDASGDEVSDYSATERSSATEPSSSSSAVGTGAVVGIIVGAVVGLVLVVVIVIVLIRSRRRPAVSQA
jgi:hypothetical protein